MREQPTPSARGQEPDVDWRAVRDLFPATRRAAYLDTASYGPGPRPVYEAVRDALLAWSEGRGDWREWEGVGEAARASFATLLGVETDTVTLLPALSVAAGLVAESLEPGPGANLVVGGEEFRSNLYPWVHQERRGFEVRVVPFREGRLPAEDVTAAVDDSTALVAVSHVQSSNGYRIALPPLIEACRRHDARLFVDATQSLGAMRVPTDGIDFIGAAAYKWLLAPRGAAFLRVARTRLDEVRPLFPGWKTPSDPYSSYYGLPFELAEDASRLDVSLAWPVWVGAARALELLNDLGLASIEERNLGLARRFREGLPAIGLRPLFDEAESSPIVGLRVGDPEAVRSAMERAGVVAAVRGDYLRAAFHFFNDEEDVDRGLAALRGTR